MFACVHCRGAEEIETLQAGAVPLYWKLNHPRLRLNSFLSPQMPKIGKTDFGGLLLDSVARVKGINVLTFSEKIPDSLQNNYLTLDYNVKEWAVFGQSYR